MTISMHGVGSAEAVSWPRLPLTFATLMSALRSNNLAAARTAYDDLARGLQPHVGSVIAPVRVALEAGDLARAGRMLGQLRGELAAVASLVPSVAAIVALPSAPVPSASLPSAPPISEAASAASVATAAATAPDRAQPTTVALDLLV